MACADPSLMSWGKEQGDAKWKSARLPRCFSTHLQSTAVMQGAAEHTSVPEPSNGSISECTTCLYTMLAKIASIAEPARTNVNRSRLSLFSSPPCKLWREGRTLVALDALLVHRHREAHLVRMTVPLHWQGYHGQHCYQVCMQSSTKFPSGALTWHTCHLEPVRL